MADKVTHIGNYRIERELWAEPLRTVFMGWQLTLNRPVQITQLTAEGTAEAGMAARWREAARDLRDPGHPHLPRILDAGFTAERPFLVETYLVGDTLAERAGQPLDLHAALKLLAGPIDALAYAHRRGWAHGAIAPETMRVTPDGSAYLTDLPWAAASHPRGDPDALAADVRAVGRLLLELLAPVAGQPPAADGDVPADERRFGSWLAAAGDGPLAERVAPVLARSLAAVTAGGYSDCAALGKAWAALIQQGRATPPPTPPPAYQTIVTPPPSDPTRPPTPPPQPVRQPTPSPYTPPQGGRPPTPPPYAPPAAAPPAAWQPSPTPPSAAWAPPVQPRRSSPITAIAVVLVTVAVLAVMGIILCAREVLPFCQSCNAGIIQEYVEAAREYAAKGAWDSADRELAAARTECATCRNEVAACTDVGLTGGLGSEAACHLATDRLVADARGLLNNDDPCPAIAKLEEAAGLGCDPAQAQSLLAGGPKGSAYVQCADRLLAEGTAEACDQAHAYLTKAHELRPADAAISQRYDQAERFVAFRTAFEGQQWDKAEDALRRLAAVTGDGAYCGTPLAALEHQVLVAQGDAAKAAGRWCQALAYYQGARERGGTAAQRAAAEAGADDVRASCQDTYTPTPTPRPTATPTIIPTATPRPRVSVKQDEVNVRSGPGTDYPALSTKAKRADVFQVECATPGSDGTWYKVIFAAGTSGWLRGDMLAATPAAQACSPSQIPAKPTPAPVVINCRPQNSLPAVTTLAPRRDATCNGPVRFSWQWSGRLQSGERFELHIWPDRNQVRRSIVQTRDTNAVVDLRKGVPWISWNDRPHFWEVVVVCVADGRWVSQTAPATLLYFEHRMPVNEGNPDANCQ